MLKGILGGLGLRVFKGFFGGGFRVSTLTPAQGGLGFRAKGV